MSATNRGAVRNPRDFYATPLLRFLPKDVAFYEPCQGDGRLVRTLRDSGRRATGADLAGGKDFLKDNKRRQFILTNPPFGLSFEITQHALKLAPEVMLLMRINFLGSVTRRDFLRRNPPNALFVITPRPSFTNGGTDACEYAWFYWGRRWQGIKWP